MNDSTLSNLISTVEDIATNLDVRPDSWREQLQAVRNTISSVHVLDTSREDVSLQLQILLISVFHRVAFADADTGTVQDVADWCLRQALHLLNAFPDNFVLLTRTYKMKNLLIWLTLYSHRTKLAIASTTIISKHQSS